MDDVEPGLEPEDSRTGEAGFWGPVTIFLLGAVTGVLIWSLELRAAKVALGIPVDGAVLRVPGGLGDLVAERDAEGTGRSPSPDPSAVPLEESYAAKDGLLTAHYPSTFAAKSLPKGSVLLDRNLGGGLDEVVRLEPVEHPISDELKEVSRIVFQGETKTMRDLELSYERPATFAGEPALEREATFSSKHGYPYLYHSIHFLHEGHFFDLLYLVPQSRRAAEEPLLQRIVAATTLP